ncbi:MAG: hypothetical protein WCH61_04560 [bacterium]
MLIKVVSQAVVFATLLPWLAGASSGTEILRSDFSGAPDAINGWTKLVIDKAAKGNPAMIVAAKSSTGGQPVLIMNPVGTSWGFLIKAYAPGELPPGKQLRVTAYVKGSQGILVITRGAKWGDEVKDCVVSGLEGGGGGGWTKLQALMDRPTNNQLVSVAIGINYDCPGGWLAIDRVVIEGGDQLPPPSQEAMPSGEVMISTTQFMPMIGKDTKADILQAAPYWRKARTSNPGVRLAAGTDPAPLFTAVTHPSDTTFIKPAELAGMLSSIQRASWLLQVHDPLKLFTAAGAIEPEDTPAFAMDSAVNATESCTVLLRNAQATGICFRLELSGGLANCASLQKMEYIAGVPDFLHGLPWGSYVEVGPGQTAGLMLSFCTKALQPGVYEGELKAIPLEHGLPMKTVRLKLTVHPATLSGQLPIAVYGIDYSKAQEPVWARLLTGLGVNTFCVSALPNPGQGNDFSLISKIVKTVREVAPTLKFSLIVETWAARAHGGWKKEFNPWLDQVVAEMQKNGLDYGDWSLYIYDETLSDEFLQSAKLIKAYNPQIRLCLTGYGLQFDDLKRSQSFFPYIANWIQQEDVLGHPVLALRQASSSNGTWVYRCDPRIEDPLTKNRRLPWLAWKHGLSGVAFWSAATTYPDERLPVSEERLPFWMIYLDAAGQPMPSRRLLAVRDGLEDYAILCLAAEQAKKHNDAELRGLIDRAVTEVTADATTAPAWRARLLKAMDK